MIQAAAPPNTAAQVRDSGWLGRLLYSLGNTVSHWFQAATLTSPDDRVNLDRSVATRKEVQDAFVDGASLIVSGIGGVKTATTVAVETAEVAAEVVAAKGSISLGAGRAGAKQWLQNAGNLERGQLIKDIEGAGFKKIFDGRGMMHFERGGMKIRLDPPQLPHTPYNHMHLNYGGKYGSYDINLIRVPFNSKAAHIPIK